MLFYLLEHLDCPAEEHLAVLVVDFDVAIVGEFAYRQTLDAHVVVLLQL